MSVKYTAQLCLKTWIDFVQAQSRLVLIITLLLAGLAFYYTSNNLGMNTDTRDMLSEELAWRQLDLEYERNFPQFTDNLTVVIEAPTPDQASDAALALYKGFLAENELFHSVYYNQALPVFRNSSLLYLDIEELEDLADSLADIQPFLSRLTSDQTVRGLFSMIFEIMDAMEDEDISVDVSPLLSQLNLAVLATQNQLPFRVSWQELMGGSSNGEAIYREFIILQPVLDYSGLRPAETSIAKVHEIADALEIESTTGTTIRLTGSAALAHEELLSVTRGVEIAMVLSICAITLIMIFGLGSVRLMAATLLTLLTGLVFTAAFAAFAVGDLNLISVAFAVLYIGLGVDFSIHYCLRYRELRLIGETNHDAIDESSMHVGMSMFMCAATTAIGFFAFIPTEYDGVAELGLISGTGMFISLVVTLTVLPVLLKLLPPNLTGRRKTMIMNRKFRQFLLLPFKYARGIRIIAFFSVLALLSQLGRIEFDHNTLNLNDPENESVKTFKDLLTESTTSPWSSVILAENAEEAELLAAEFEKLPLVDSTVWLNDFIPEDQEDKILLIEDMFLLLGEIPTTDSPSVLTAAQRRAPLEEYLSRIRSLDTSTLNPEFSRLEYNLSRFLAYLDTQDEDARARLLADLETRLLASLPGRIDALNDSLQADFISLDILPPELTEQWRNDEGKHIVQIFPRENIYDNDALRRFVTQIQGEDKRVIGSPIVSIEASDAVVAAFQQAFLYAFVVIVLFLLLLLRSIKDTIYIIIPLIVAAVCTCGISVIFNIPFNFANVIALPLILGIGVDSGIHILHRFRTALPDDHNLLATSSARAVVVSALTSICSIGNLAFSPHLGMASMGKLLTTGIAITLICMLILLPSLLALELAKRNHEPG